MTQHALRLKRLVWTALYRRHTSSKIVSLRKALTYRRAQLLAPTLVALKRVSFLGKMHKEIALIRAHRLRQQTLSRWAKAVFQKQLCKQT